MNLVMAINLGADDFVAKPFRMEVLTAKIQAVLRRTYTFGTVSPSVLTHKGLTLNLDTSVLSYGQEKLELGKNEFGILRTLMEHPGKIIERSVLIRNLWETESFIDDNTLTVNVTRLRRRLEDIGLKTIFSPGKVWDTMWKNNYFAAYIRAKRDMEVLFLVFLRLRQ